MLWFRVRGCVCVRVDDQLRSSVIINLHGGAAGKVISEEEGNNSLIPSSTHADVNKNS